MENIYSSSNFTFNHLNSIIVISPKYMDAKMCGITTLLISTGVETW